MVFSCTRVLEGRNAPSPRSAVKFVIENTVILQTPRQLWIGYHIVASFAAAHRCMRPPHASALDSRFLQENIPHSRRPAMIQRTLAMIASFFHERSHASNKQGKSSLDRFHQLTHDFHTSQLVQQPVLAVSVIGAQFFDGCARWSGRRCYPHTKALPTLVDDDV